MALSVGEVEALIRLREQVSPAINAVSKAISGGVSVTLQWTASQQRAAMAMAGVHDQARELDRAFEQAASSTDQWTEAQQRAAMAMSSTHEEAMAMNVAFDSSTAKGAQLASTVGSVSTVMARAATSIGLPADALKGLDIAADAAALGLGKLNTAAAGFTAASLGVVGVGLAIGATFGTGVRALGDFDNALSRGIQRLGLFGFTVKELDDTVGAMWRTLSRAPPPTSLEDMALAATRAEIAFRHAGIAQVDAAMDGIADQRKAVEQMLSMGVSIEGIRERIQDLDPAIEGWLDGMERTKEAHDQATEAAKKAAEEAKRAITERLNFEEKLTSIVQANISAYFDAQRDAIDAAAALAQASAVLQAQIDAAAAMSMKKQLALPELNKVIDPALGLWTRYADVVEQELENASGEVEEHEKTLQDYANDAVEWLGSVTTALDQLDGFFAMLGVSADSSLRKVTQGLADVASAGADFAQALASGNILDQIAAGIGLVTTAIGAVGNVIRDVEWEQVNDLRDDFVEAAGGIDELNKRAVAAGLSLDQLLDAKKVKDFDEAVQMLETRLEFIESFGGLEGLKFQADLANISLDGLFNAQGARELSAEITLIQQQLGLWNDANEKLNAAVEKYGFTIAELGPKFAQQKLDEQFGQLFQDYQLLSAAGVDHNAILERMGPAFNEYVQSALAAGGTIPEALRPAIEALIANGQLLDENGVAFGSVEEAGISFAQTLEEGISKLIDKVTDLVNALLGIPNIERTVTVGTNLPGGDPLDGLPEFALGGRTESDPGSFVRGGRGGGAFLGVLHPNETVVPDSQATGFALGALTGGGGAVELAEMVAAAVAREVRAVVAEGPAATLNFAPTLNNTESPFATEQGKAEAKLHTQAAFKQMLRDLEPDVQHLLKRAVGNK